MKEIDCRGLSCPEPVINTKRALKESPDGVVVLVDNRVPLENISRFAQAMGYNASSVEKNGEWTITIKK
jgi:TusA-related sulfurtransferase